MRIASKAVLASLAALLVALAGLAAWANRRQAHAAEQAIASTAAQVRQELEAALDERGVESLLTAEPSGRLRLYEALASMARSSELVRSVVVADAAGGVVASSAFEEIGGQREAADEIFAAGLEPRLTGGGEGAAPGEPVLYLPLVEGGAAAGYVRAALTGSRLPELRERAEETLWVAAVFGVLAISAVGLLLRAQLASSGARLARDLERVRLGEPPAGGRRDEFAQAFEIARELGRELKQAKEQGNRSASRLALLSAVADTGVVLLGPSGEPDFVNRRALELLGCREEVELKARWAGLRERLAAALAAGAGMGRRERIADLEIEAGGPSRRLRIAVSGLGGPEEREGTLLLVKDRSLVEALETDLRASAQLRSLARFLVAMMHDLKAPLNAMNLNLELLRASFDERVAETGQRQRRYVGILAEELARLDRALGLLLSSAVPGSAAEQTFDLRELAGELEMLLAPLAKRQMVELSCEVPAEPVRVRGQRDRLKQALLNIALNGLEAMADGGGLRLGLESGDGRARLVVADTGPGIPPEVLPKIWEMHFTTKDSGTGVGLYVARSTVESFGGEIAVETAPGAGARFLVSLPLAA